MSLLKKTASSALEALNKAQEVASNLPPASYESIDTLYNFFRENGAIFEKIFPSQRSLKSYLEDSKVDVWARSSSKGESIKLSDDPRESKNVIIYEKFYVDTEQAVAALEKKFKLYGTEHAKDSRVSKRGLNRRFPHPLDVVQNSLNGARLRCLSGTKIADLEGDELEQYRRISKAQEELAKLKAKVSKLKTKHHLADSKRREEFISKNYKMMMEGLIDNNILEVAGLIPSDYSELEYLKEEWGAE